MKRDELNILADDYYSVMDISKNQKEKRKETAWTLYDVFMLFFIWLREAKEQGIEEYSYYLPQLQNELQDVVSKHMVLDNYMLIYLSTISLGVFNVTKAHMSEEYYLSEDRAANLALNESLSINNHVELEEAKRNGYTRKRWCTELDNRVRPTHMEMEGVTIPIDDLFIVGDSEMEMPHDVTHGASMSEVSNCRCWLEYAKE